MRADDRTSRLLIVGDHELVREGLGTMLSREADLEVVGEAQDGRQAVELCRELRPDLVLMDGLAATRAIRTEPPALAFW